MTETLDPMDQLKIDQQQLAQQLLAQTIAEGVEPVRPNGNRWQRNWQRSSFMGSRFDDEDYAKHAIFLLKQSFAHNSGLIRVRRTRSREEHPGTVLPPRGVP